MKRIVGMSLVLWAFAAHAWGADLPILEQWSGVVRDDALPAVVPAEAIRDKETWEKTWKLVRTEPAEAVPVMDWEKEMILVAIVPGPNRGRVGALTLDDSGNVNVVAAGTRMGGPGFGYVFVKVGRAGIKSVNGKPLDASTKPATRPAG